jgi:hypothetical protein
MVCRKVIGKIQIESTPKALDEAVSVGFILSLIQFSPN